MMATIDIRGATLSAADPPVGTDPNPGLAIKAPVRAATTGGNIALAGLFTLDGVVLAAGDRVLVKDQADATANGLYNAATGPWTRTVDAADNSQFATGLDVVVTNGIVNGGGMFQLTTANAVVLGTSPLTWARVSMNVNPFVGDGGAGGFAGLVPAPPAGSAAANRFLMASGSFTALAAGMVGFTQAGTGAVARTVDARLKDACLCITDFGGAGDNTTDNAAPLNRALAALTGTGGCIYFPAGKYRFNSAVSFNLPAGVFSVSLIGAGQDATVLTWPNAAGGMTFNYGGINSSAHIRDLSITTGVANGGNAITLNLATPVGNPAVFAQSDLNRVTFRGDDGYEVANYWSTGVNVVNVSNVIWDSVAVYGASIPSGNGISLIGLPASSTYGVQYNIAKCTLQNLNAGIVYGSFIQGVTVDQTNFTGTNQGIISPSLQTGTLAQLSVTNSQFGITANNGGIVTLTPIVETMIANSLFIVLGSNGTAINLNANNHFVITGNEITASVTSGTGGILVGTSTGGSRGLITGNDIFGYGTGISLQAGSQNISIQSNVFSNNTIAINNAGTSNFITNNPGYNPVGPSSISVGASPFTYTAGASPETVYIWNGTVSSVTFDKNGGSLGTVAFAQTNCAIDLGPFEQLKVTYSAAPNMNKMVH